ncbi:glycosyltransferase WbuB [Leptospira yasudae]|uniref:glycosyltransferase family 4 protein n=1 Tax=Leptospira yasudae TaxID=2202201 RepID=UPI001083D84A|nr:glycosyltransferase family 4 protein [Leptospira yasudae]TGK24539.1 glycosyltransferase WbuB [Leptospira yasudae]TGM05675.1 glycosyltransferase WbuB [Leptospira yasudae]
MKICIIVDDYLPGSTKVAAKMMHDLGKSFLACGHEVTVITPGPELNSSYQRSVLDGIKVYRFASGQIKNVSKIKRAINESLLSYRAWRVLRKIFDREKNDLIVYYSPSIFWGMLVRKLKRKWNASSYLILRDFFPQWAIDNGLIGKKSFITKYFRIFERINYDAADTIGIQSPRNVDWFKNEFPQVRNIEVLFNWAENSPIQLSDYPYRRSLGLQNKVIFFYGGNIGHAQDMSNILRLAKSMKGFTNAHFVLIGNGDEIELVKRKITQDSLTNLTLLDPVPQEEFKKMLAEFDIGLFTLHKEHQTHNFPGKVLGYMVQGMPILGCVNPGNDLKEIIEEADAGLVTVSGDDETFKENAIRLLDLNVRRSMGENAKTLLEDRFSVSSAVTKILNAMN